MDPVAQTILEMVAKSKQLDPAILTPATTFDELQIDSLDKINLSFEVEEHFGIAIPDDSLNSLRTIGDVIAGVHRLLALKTAPAEPHNPDQALNDPA